MLILLSENAFDSSMELIRSIGAMPIDYSTYVFGEYACERLGGKEALMKAFEVSYKVATVAPTASCSCCFLSMLFCVLLKWLAKQI